MSAKSVAELLGQLLPIAGTVIVNLDVLGRPAGLVKNIGSGLKNFVYQPIRGAMESPYGLIVGLRQGTTSLVSGVVGGALDSAESIVESASKIVAQSAASLTGDEEFAKQQLRHRLRKSRTSGRGGFLDGLYEGGECIQHGISSGLSGIISKPLAGGRKNGVVGFLGGLGSGIVGGMVKPVVGLATGMASIAHGLSETVSTGERSTHIRPPRALIRSPTDPMDATLGPLDLDSAFAQEYVLKQARLHTSRADDFYIQCIRFVYTVAAD